MSDDTQPAAPAPTDPQLGTAAPPADTGVPATPPAADASADPNAQPEGDEGEQPEQPKKQRGGFQKRIHEQTAKIRALERQLAEVTAPKPDAKGDADAAPKREDFASYEDYIRAEAAHTARQEFAKVQREHAKARTVEAYDARVEALRSEMAADAAADPTFAKAWATVSAPGFPVSDHMGDFIAESDDPNAIIEWLASNRAEAEKLYSAPGAQVYRTLARVEAKASSPSARTPQAPPPPPTVGGRSAPRTNMDNLARNKNPDEYIRLRREQMAKAQ